MAEEKEYQTLQEVIDAHLEWEQKQEARTFAYDLWKTAEKTIMEKNTEAREYGTERLALAVFSELRRVRALSICLTDTLRENVVRRHARGMSTTEIVKDILDNDQWEQITPFFVFKFSNVCGYETIKNFLVSRLGYLKKSHPRFPHKKYGEVWTQERQQFIETLQDIPLATPAEQLHELTQQYQKLKVLFDDAGDAKDRERYHNCMMKTLAAIHLIGRDNAHMPHAITQEKNTKALPTQNSDNVLEFTLKENESVKVN